MVYYILFGFTFNVCVLLEYRNLLHEKAAIRLNYIQNCHSTAQKKQTHIKTNTYRKIDHAFNCEFVQYWTVTASKYFFKFYDNFNLIIFQLFLGQFTEF